MALPYSEGTAFLVPLRIGGYARGVVARTSPNGKVLFGYFFGPRLLSINTISLDDLEPSQAIMTLRFGDLGLTNGDWPILGIVPNWDRSKWAMVDFTRRDYISQKAWLVRYSDDDPNCVEAEFPIEFDTESPRDSVSGYGAVEIKISKLLDNGLLVESDRSNHLLSMPTKIGCASATESPIHHYLYFPERQVGERVANVLRSQGYVVEDRPGADEVQWLVLAKCNAAPTNATINEQRKFLEQIAKENNGEYDGWEADVQNG